MLEVTASLDRPLPLDWSIMFDWKPTEIDIDSLGAGDLIDAADRQGDGEVSADFKVVGSDGVTRPGYVTFMYEVDRDGDVSVDLEFAIGGSKEVTGLGGELRIFSTVLRAIRTFMDRFGAVMRRLEFSASKLVGSPTDRRESRSREKLYDRLVKRHIGSIRGGWSLRKRDYGSFVDYVLSR